VAREKDRIFEIAQKITQKKALKKSVKEYQQILKENPDDFKTRIKLADIYLRRGELARAIDEYFRVGEYYIQEELDLKAIAIFKKILVLNTGIIEAFYKLADLYSKRGLFGEAKIQYKKILEINHNEKKAKDALLQIESKMTKNGVHDRTIVQEKDREKDPVWNAILDELQRQLTNQIRNDDYQVHYHLGVAFKEMGLLEKAIEEFKIALMDSNLEFDVNLLMGICFREMGNYNEAIENFRKLLRMKDLNNKQSENLYYQLGLTFEECGQTENALEAFTKATELRGGTASAEFQSKMKKLKEQLRGE